MPSDQSRKNYQHLDSKPLFTARTKSLYDSGLTPRTRLRRLDMLLIIHRKPPPQPVQCVPQPGHVGDIILDRLKSRPMMERTPASTRRILTEDVRSDMWRSTEQTCQLVRPAECVGRCPRQPACPISACRGSVLHGRRDACRRTVPQNSRQPLLVLRHGQDPGEHDDIP